MPKMFPACSQISALLIRYLRQYGVCSWRYLVAFQMMKPRVGVVALAYPGYNLGEELCEGKLAEMRALLAGEAFELVVASAPALDDASIQRAGDVLAAAGVDCLLAVLTTFVPDYYITRLLHACDKPIFLWAVEREMPCIALVCGPLVTASLYNLEKRYALHGADIGDAAALQALRTFARAAMLQRLLRTMRVGYSGGKPPIMFSTAVDEYALAKTLGVTVVHLPIEEVYRAAAAIPEHAAAAYWADTCRGVGQAAVREEDGLQSSRYALATRALAADYRLDAFSVNCFPHLKSQVCLAVARLNDDGVAAACEGDLHSTILMYLLQCLTGRAAFNGDLLRLYEADNAILFSHCGAGAFSLAAEPCAVCLHASIETLDGLAVRYPTHLPGPVTLLNLMYGRGTLRLAGMRGQGVETDLQYEGTPLRVQFRQDVRGIVQGVARHGAGHHWNGGPADVMGEFSLLCEWLGIEWNVLTP